MQIVWNGIDSYRAFVDLNPPRFCLVSNRFDEKGQAVTVGDVLLVACDAHHYFCDLELLFRAPSAISEYPPVPAQAFAADLVTSVPLSDPVRWSFSQDTGVVHIEIGQAVSSLDWFRLGTNAVWLGISLQQEIRAIFCSNVRLDPNGEEEAHWLDGISA